MRIEAAPAIFKIYVCFTISCLHDPPYFFRSESEPRELAKINGWEFIQWPAKFDAVKGVWYWESEEE